MTSSQAWMIWPENPALSILVLALLGMVFLYAARRPMHELLHAVGGLIGAPLRVAARWLAATANAMRQRNKASSKHRMSRTKGIIPAGVSIRKHGARSATAWAMSLISFGVGGGD